jgi:hypothetical protein
MHQRLQARGLAISEREVTHLMQRYEEVVTLRVTDRERVKARLQQQGRVILALDGLPPDVGHEVLWVVRDCLSEEILLARPLLEPHPGGCDRGAPRSSAPRASHGRCRSKASSRMAKRRSGVRWLVSSQKFPINS